MSTLTPAPARAGQLRDVALDRIRGLAVALMLVDHVALLLGVLPLRLTVGRLAMPLFFLVAGHLAHRLSARHVNVVAAGVALTFLAPWAGEPSILLWIVLGCALIVAARFSGFPLVLLIVVPLTLAANRWQLGAVGYDPAALVALMVVGATLPRTAFAWGSRLPAVLGAVGRRPLTWYVGHVAVLTFLAA
jgi:hypothetical protein